MSAWRTGGMPMFLRTAYELHEKYESVRFCARRVQASRLLAWVAHASRVLVMTSRHRGLSRRRSGFQEERSLNERLFRRDAESPSRTGITRQTRALPGKNPRSSA